MNDAEITPIDRPLRRSDLDEIRRIVWSISQRQIAQQHGQRAVVTTCILCMLVCLGCVAKVAVLP